MAMKVPMMISMDLRYLWILPNLAKWTKPFAKVILASSKCSESKKQIIREDKDSERLQIEKDVYMLFNWTISIKSSKVNNIFVISLKST